jgi:zinc transport system substrate-binding protein
MERSIITVLACFILVTTLCSEKQDTGKINVVVSIVPLQEFVSKVGGDRVDVAVMVPPGASPHSYEPTPAQLVRVSKAHIYIKIGTPIEFEVAWLEKLLAMNSTMYVCDASSGIDVISTSEGGQGRDNVDPHIWLSPQNAKAIVINICNALVAIDKDSEQYYTTRRDAFCRELDHLHHKIVQMLKKRKTKTFLVYHASWQYFARDYGFQQISIEANGKEPTAQNIVSVIHAAREHNVTTVFVSPQFSTKSADVIAGEIGGTVTSIDPLAHNYLENIGEVARLLSRAAE